MSTPVFADRPLWTVPEVASFLQVSEKTIRLWVRDGKIPSSKIGRKRRFVRADIEAFVRERSTPVTTSN